MVSHALLLFIVGLRGVFTATSLDDDVYLQVQSGNTEHFQLHGNSSLSVTGGTFTACQKMLANYYFWKSGVSFTKEIPVFVGTVFGLGGDLLQDGWNLFKKVVPVQDTFGHCLSVTNKNDLCWYQSVYIDKNWIGSQDDFKGELDDKNKKELTDEIWEGIKKVAATVLGGIAGPGRTGALGATLDALEDLVGKITDLIPFKGAISGLIYAYLGTMHSKRAAQCQQVLDKTEAARNCAEKRFTNCASTTSMGEKPADSCKCTKQDDSCQAGKKRMAVDNGCTGGKFASQPDDQG